MVYLQKISGNFFIPEVYSPSEKAQTLLKSYSLTATFASLFFEIFYLCAATFAILYAFSKTQAGELGYFLLFLLSLFLDCFRIAVPLLQIPHTYSSSLLTLQNIIFTGTILTPLSLLGMVLFSGEEYRQNLEQNCLIIIVAAAFVAFTIPLNTGIMYPHFAISCAFKKIVWLSYISLSLISVFSLFLNNLRNENSQLMTLGFFLLSLGTILLRQSFTYIQLAFGGIFLTGGTLLYFKELHNRYLWDN